METGPIARLMDGELIARPIRDQVQQNVDRIRAAAGVTPCLATVLVGNDPSSAVYVRAKRKRCESVGISSLTVELPGDTTTDRVIAQVDQLAADPAVHGILIQHPAPRVIDRRTVFERIPAAKDVDGVTSASLGRTILGLPAFGSCTPTGIMRLLRAYQVLLEGADAVVIGRSPILGRPLVSMLINAHATVTLCHSRTRNLSEIARRADILIAAVGRPAFVQGDWIKPGAVVIDAGYNPGPVGDVDFQGAMARASLLTPVPGGVGPMTLAVLLDQTALAAAKQLGLPGP